MLSLFLLLACTGKDTDDTSTPDDTADTGDTTDTGDTADTGDTGMGADWELVVTTTDYTTGALARVDSAKVLHDSLAVISSDAAVQVQDGEVYLLSRSSQNAVSVYRDGDYTTPVLNFSTGDGSNPHGVAKCGGYLFVSLYSTATLGVYDPATGLSAGTVDLSAFDDGDGSPEPDALYAAPNGALYVVMNQLDYVNTYESADGSGTLAKVDCATFQVTESWDVGPNPSFDVDPRDADQLLLSGGNWFNDDWSGPELDGYLQVFDTSTDTLGDVLMTEEEAGFNLGGVAGGADGKVITTFDTAYTWTVVCMDLNTGDYTTLDAGNAFIGALEASPDGLVWASQSLGFGEGDATTGFVAYDPATCTVAASVTPTLGPSSMAVRTW